MPVSYTHLNENMRELLGGKGANLAEMVRLGMPVPQGFTVSTEACKMCIRDRASCNTLRYILVRASCEDFDVLTVKIHFE